MSEPNDGMSIGRLLKVLVPVLAVALAVRLTLPGYEQAAQQELEATVLSKMLGQASEGPAEPVAFVDSDGDLLCDSPADGECLKPETLVFTYIGGPEEEDEAATWADLTAALGEATGLPVEYKSYASVEEQLAALASGELHVAGLNTGAVPTAVAAAGFHPVCTLGAEDGSFGYTMKLLGKAGGVTELAALKGKQVAFVSPDSNSGFKAALVYLMAEQDLLPERDYPWRFTYSHDASVAGLVAGEHDAAPVASDLLDRMVAEGEVAEDALAVVYESERFPPAAIGYAYNLTPELRQQIADTLLGFAWEGTSVAAEYGSTDVTKFVPVTYKDDWANIRRIDEAVANAKQSAR